MRPWRVVLAGLVVALAARPAVADLSVETTRYTCERGVEVPATYVSDTAGDGQGVVVIHPEGSQITLYREPSTVGVRYGWPSDGSSYVWWSDEGHAVLSWKDGVTGEELPLLAECQRQ